MTRKPDRCYGCGRLMGLKSPMECPCWRSRKEGARIPGRIASMQRRILDIYKALGEASNDRERRAAASRASACNATLRTLGEEVR